MSRVQLALNVDDVEQAVAFYSKLFGSEPARRRPGYANFAIADPPLKLVLLENPGQGGSLNHLGVEVPDVDVVDAEQTRLAEAGLASVDERDTTCCYAKQDKFWVEGAEGLALTLVVTVGCGFALAAHPCGPVSGGRSSYGTPGLSRQARMMPRPPVPPRCS